MIVPHEVLLAPTLLIGVLFRLQNGPKLSLTGPLCSIPWSFSRTRGLVMPQRSSEIGPLAKTPDLYKSKRLKYRGGFVQRTQQNGMRSHDSAI